MSSQPNKSTKRISMSYQLIRQMDRFEKKTLAQMLLESRRPVTSITPEYLDALLTRVAWQRKWTAEPGKPEFGTVL